MNGCASKRKIEGGETNQADNHPLENDKPLTTQVESSSVAQIPQVSSRATQCQVATASMNLNFTFIVCICGEFEIEV